MPEPHASYVAVCGQRCPSLTRVIRRPVAVTCWGDLPAEPRLPGVLRVLIAGQHAGAAERAGDSWVARWTTAGNRDRRTEHASAEKRRDNSDPLRVRPSARRTRRIPRPLVRSRTARRPRRIPGLTWYSKREDNCYLAPKSPNPVNVTSSVL